MSRLGEWRAAFSPAPTTLPTKQSTAAATQGLLRGYHPARRAVVVSPARIAAFSPSTVLAPPNAARHPQQQSHGRARGEKDDGEGSACAAELHETDPQAVGNVWDSPLLMGKATISRGYQRRQFIRRQALEG